MFDFLDVLAALPQWLVVLGDGEEVRAALANLLPEARAGELVVLACEPSRLRLKDGGWAGSYVVTVGAPSGTGARTVRLRGTLLTESEPLLPIQPVPFGDPGWRMALPGARLLLATEPVDADLPSLPLLTDPDSTRTLLEQAIRTAPGYDGYRLRACRPQIMRHKPGSRCTVLYRLEYDDDDPNRGWPGVVVAKTYRGDKGAVAWRGMQELWHSPMMTSGVTLGEPLAFLPSINVLVQGPVPEERTLKESIHSAVRSGDSAELAAVTATVRATAGGLAALHNSQVTHGELVTWDDEHVEVQRIIDRIGRHAPEAGRAGSALLDQLAALGSDAPAETARPAHRSFRPAQVLLQGDAIGFIDFDGFCQAEPALDVALFRTTVGQLGSRPEHEPLLAGLADEFLAEYQRHGKVSVQRVALWEALDLLTRLLHTWTKVKPEKAPEALAALQAHLSAGLGMSPVGRS